MPDQFGPDVPDQLPARAQESAIRVPASHGGLPSALEIMLNPAMDRQVGEIARRMAGARGLTPRHLLGCEEACYAVVLQAINWNLNPFSVACATYQTPGGRIGYEGKLVHAILEQSHRFERDEIKHELFGPWENVRGKFTIAESPRKDAEGQARYYAKRTWERKDAQGCGIKVSATLRNGGGERSLSLLLEQCYPMNSTLWATDPETQIGYTADRRFGTAVVPGIFMGVPIAPDAELLMAGDDAIDVTEPRAARPQRAGQHIVEGTGNEDPLPWSVYDSSNERFPFATAAGATSAVVKIFDAATRSARPKEAIAAAWENNQELLRELGEMSGFEQEIHDVEAAYQAALAAIAPKQTAPSPGAREAVPDAPQGNTAPARQETSAPKPPPRAADLFWQQPSLTVGPATKGRVPDWKTWPLFIGPRVRQAGTLEQLNALIADNQENFRMYGESCGAEAAQAVSDMWDARKAQL